MDRLTQLRAEAGGSGDSTLDTSASPSEAYLTANESSKYFSLSEDDSSFDISPIKDVSLASTVEPDKSITGNDQLISTLTPITKKNDLLGGYKFGKQIEAANILSGGVDIFDDNDNSYDGDELVIDDNAEIDDKSNPELKLIENTELPFQKTDEIVESLDSEPAIGSKDTEVVLQIDGKNVNAIDIGNGLYLYRKAGEEELAAVQIVADENDQPTFKFLKVRENAEGNLEVYEEIEIEVPKEVPTKDEKSGKNTSHVPIKDINKVISEPVCNKVAERKKPQQEIKPIASTSDTDDSNKVVLAETKTEINLNGKMMKYNETRKSPVIHSKPNKEGIPLTKTMVNMHLHPSRPLDKVKTIEVHTDNMKQRINEIQAKHKAFSDDQKSDTSTCNKEIEKPAEITENVAENKKLDEITSDVTVPKEEQKESNTPENTEIQPVEFSKPKETLSSVLSLDTENRERKTDKEDKFETASLKDKKKMEENDKNVPKLSDKPKSAENEKETGNTEMSIKKDDTSLTKVALKDSVCETDISSLISNKSSQINVKSQQGRQQSMVKQKDPHIGNEIKSSNKPENEKAVKISTDTSTKPLEVSDKEEKLKDIQKPENISSKNSYEAILFKSSSEKLNNNITEMTTTLQKNYKTTDNIALENKINAGLKPQDVVIPALPNKDESTAQNLEQKKAVHPEVIAKKTPVTEIKQSDLKTSTKPETCKDTSEPETKQLDQEKDILSDVKDNTHILDTNQLQPAEISKEAVAVIEPVPDKPLKEESKQQEKPKLISNKEDIQTIQDEINTESKIIRLPPTLPIAPQRKLEITKLPSTVEKKPVSSSSTEKKPIINNNAAVPFGQWTSANRQEFLNKIKEAKIPVTVSNTKPISKLNDLNRRDVLQKIDSQRQSSNAASKNQEFPKMNVKNEAPTFTNKPAVIQPSAMIRESKADVKVEEPTLKNKPELLKKIEKPKTAQTSHIPQPNSTVTSTYVAKSEGPNRNEFNKQDLIDKTVEGIINRAVATKHQDSKPNVPKEPMKTQTTYTASYKSKESKPSILDAIEMKMNELHGIPFVERPPHQLPKVYNRDVKTYAKADTKSANRVSKIPNLLPVTKIQQKDVKDDVIDLDSEEDVIEHEPITGDIDFNKKNITSKQSNTSAETNMAQIGSDSSIKESIITEKDFDKFVRRNSITYENCLTVNIETNKNRNVVKGLVQKDVTDMNTKKVMPETHKSPAKQKSFLQNSQPHKINITSKLVPVNEDAFNKNYQSKLQLAYQTALTTKRQMESPITILEDKPVKVVFMDSNTNFQASQLNVQGPDLSPSKKSVTPKEPDSITIGIGDSLDSVEDLKPQDDIKSNKTKHQRKQVLTPVEAPELELIVPGDLGIEVSPKKKRRIDDFKIDKSPKTLVPKKSYLLGRNANSECPNSQDSTEVAPKQIEERNIIVTHKDTASAIDNLVKAAELIENQAGNFKPDVPTSDKSSPATPVKRGRGRPRKYPLPDGTPNNPKAPSPQKKPRLINNKEKARASLSASDEDTSDGSSGEGIIRENWTMGKINENIVCPICNKLFRSENVVFKHVKHCTGPSPNRSDSDKRSSRRSRFSNDSKSMDSKLDDTDGEMGSVISKKSTLKKRKSKEQSPDSKEDLIVIEDTPVKNKIEKSNEPKEHESRKPTKTKAQYKVSSLSCEICGKTFRQLSYLVSHKLLHKKANPKTPESATEVSNKSVFGCEVCKKEFRKLHHLVQHRFIHNPSSVLKPSRKSSSEKNDENKISKDKETKQAEDQSAAFRCEPCDKSFRKLHHLVEHRETHDGIKKHKGSSQTAQTTEKVIQNPPPPPQCDICKKSFRKLHHLIEHKEQHMETSSEKSDDKSVKSALSTKDIIHECSLCYMVFPNEHSLNKHSVFCQKKKRQSIKPSKQSDEAVTAESNEIADEKEVTSTLEPAIPKSKEIVDKTEDNAVENKEPVDVKKASVSEIKEIRLSKEEEKLVELPIVPNKIDLEISSSPPVKAIEASPEAEQKLKITEEKADVEPKTTIETPKKKSPVKGPKGMSAAKRRKSNLPLARIKEAAAMESSDDEEIRYMLNPDYKDSSSKPDVDDPSSEVKLFMEVRAKKRNSLQFERPNSKELVKRRTSLQQHPPKIPRLKAKVSETNDPPANAPPPTILKPAKLEPVPCTDSDDSDVKYSFPVKLAKPLESEKAPKEKRKSVSEKASKPAEDEKRPKEKRKSLAEKRKTLSGIARRKSLGKPASAIHREKPSPVKEIKRRRAEVEHRCDCGQLFSSAALLARHTTLAHTPPRVRRRRVESPAPAPAPPAPAARKSSVHKPADSRKSSARSETDHATTPKAKPGRPPGKTKTPTSALQSRKSVAHRGVPVPEKMKKIMEKLKK